MNEIRELKEPTVGRIVRYVLPSSSPRSGEIRPAIITRVWTGFDGKENQGMVNLQVFQDQSDDFGDGTHQARWIGSVCYDGSKEHGTWHYPEIV